MQSKMKKPKRPSWVRPGQVTNTARRFSRRFRRDKFQLPVKVEQRLEQEQAEVQRAFAKLPEDKRGVVALGNRVQVVKWSTELSAVLGVVREVRQVEGVWREVGRPARFVFGTKEEALKWLDPKGRLQRLTEVGTQGARRVAMERWGK